MTKKDFNKFLKQHQLAVISTISPEILPEAAFIGFAMSKDMEINFDTVKTSSKYKSLLKDPSVPLVIDWDKETTVQIEGIELN